MRLILVALVLLIGCRDGPERERSQPPTPRADFGLANVIVSTPVRSSDPAVESAKEYTFTVGGERFRLDKVGRFTCGLGATERGAFQLDLRELPYVEDLQFVSYGSDVLILLYELSDGEGGIARISRVYLPTCEPVFTSDLPGFNLGAAVLDQSALYVTVHGFVGKFNVETWGFDWTHGNLYDRYKLNAFAAPIVYRDRVVFPETASSSGRAARNVIVQKESGAIAILAAEGRAATTKPAG